jgi:hypothetical protein
MVDTKILNPLTNRYIKKDGETYKKLVAQGIISSNSKTPRVFSKGASPKRTPVSEEVSIHDNGGRPFKVKITPSSIDVSVNQNGKYKHFKTWKDYLNIWIGVDKCDKKFSYGNSVLVQLKKNKYLSIGMEIVSFTLDKNIKEYHSPIGRNDVPYPWFSDEDNHVYLLVTPTEIEHFKVSDEMMKTFDDCASSDLCKNRKCNKSDPYQEIWHKKSIPEKSIYKLQSKMVHPRV